jgi:putative restriction endonuclease
VQSAESALEAEFDRRLRESAMAWLAQRERHGGPVVRRADLQGFAFEGKRIPLADHQTGIWKPKELTAALSITTTYTPPGSRRPYEDVPGADGLLRYKYRGTDPGHFQNRALRAAVQSRAPLIWFYGIADGLYLPRYPVWLVADEPADLQVAVALDESQLYAAPALPGSADQRRYAERVTRQRLHQPVFRAQVLAAYRTQCSVCRLRHADLLDAAHIIPDRDPRGLAAVSNGLSLCKIHHAAYDKHILGVNPNLVVEIRADILHEIDGPMLKHGLQEMNGVTLTLPRSTTQQPDRSAVEERYAQFRSAAA